MSAILKNVTITGAAGSVGTVVLKRLIDSGKFNITVLRRSGSKSTFPAGTKVVDADFESVESLTAVLKGQDALISTVGGEGIPGQKALIEAAVAAGVKRFIPSEYGCDMDHPGPRKLPVFVNKIALQDFLKQTAKTSDLSYTFLYSGPFLDWGLRHNFILNTSEYKPIIYDGGNTVFSATTLDGVADSIVGVLTKPDQTKNISLRYQSTKLTQNKLLELAKQAAPGKDWQPQQAKLDDVIAVADARLAKGLYDAETFIPYLFRSIFDPEYGPSFDHLDNELLGVKQISEADVLDILKQIVKA